MSNTLATTGTRSSSGIDPVAYGYDRPVLFYALATAIPWACWVVAGWLSHLPEQTQAVRMGTTVFGLAGLIAPVLVMLWLLRDKPALRADLWRRLLWRRGVQRRYIACAVFLLLASIFLAQAVSLLFGYSAGQFALRDGFSFSSGLVPVWMILVLAPLLEELAWHGYGTDALVSRMRLFTASLVFTVIWTLWHLPLSLINGYYHSEVVAQGWLHAVNFPLSMIPFVLIMNWLYYRTGRSVTVAIVFHITAGYVNEIFMTHPDTKIIQTVLLLAFAAVVVVRNRDLFFGAPRLARGMTQ